ncbi:MAG: YgiT-type zinc finger protein [Chloroflexi bacterium]|nr:YgiT-type zinc finger protein [Chloroflexota bacterium]
MNTIGSETGICAICGSPLAQKTIDYIDRNDGHYLIVHNVPVRECLENGHQFFHASVARKIERLFELDRRRALKPTSIVPVPMVELDAVV